MQLVFHKIHTNSLWFLAGCGSSLLYATTAPYMDVSNKILISIVDTTWIFHHTISCFPHLPSFLHQWGRWFSPICDARKEDTLCLTSLVTCHFRTFGEIIDSSRLHRCRTPEFRRTFYTHLFLSRLLTHDPKLVNQLTDLLALIIFLGGTVKPQFLVNIKWSGYDLWLEQLVNVLPTNFNRRFCYFRFWLLPENDWLIQCHLLYILFHLAYRSYFTHWVFIFLMELFQITSPV